MHVGARGARVGVYVCMHACMHAHVCMYALVCMHVGARGARLGEGVEERHSIHLILAQCHHSIVLTLGHVFKEPP